jgi:hypothetical protein
MSNKKMRMTNIIVLCAALAGCGTSGQGVTTSNRTGDQFIGKNVDAVIARFGNPSQRKKLDNDQMVYVWQLLATDLPENQKVFSGYGGLYGDGLNPDAISDDIRACRLTVTTSVEGNVTQFNAEDLNGTGAPKATTGLIKSVCAQRL